MERQNRINEFLWSCAGVNKEVLRLYPNEYAKYAGSGGTILFTALMAMISGGYAMFFVFDSVIAAVIFAMFWGMLIFNLDRFIVNSMHTDGKDTLSWKKIKAALPRFIMAIFLGIVISTPLEMKIFNDRIESQLLKDNITRINEAKKESKDYNTITLLKAELSNLSKERKTLSDELQKAQRDLKEEAEGNALSGIAGHGSIYRDKEIYVAQCKSNLDEWDKLHQSRMSTVQKRIDEVNQHIESFEEKIDNLKEDGFSARYEAFANLKNDNPALATVSLMITLLFIIIEITPTFFKLIMTAGPYDNHTQIDNYKVCAYAAKEKAAIETDLKLTEIENKKRLKPEIYVEELKPITYGAAQNQEPEIVPYKLKSNTQIKTVKKRLQELPGSTTNKYGQVVLNFTSKTKSNW
ncbi:MAG: hypothetical protein [Hatfieldvirus porci]|uniref:DUF4407 domain-containing protein n=1 Tax=phage Lak_Megaphage_RVC_JS4_GC31 TaxID=3109228 RepID=A0ABZ0Z4K4_9CAUD|nr:MAG: hypothetical protein [phage Lak_Megaphage_RVC_AP3_GC31]WQJ52995.1 MAG: hypothetical protein [phage Lak_Megaphage_RVC_JS4_GC31]